MADKNNVIIFIIGILVVLILGMFLQKNYQLFSTMSGATIERIVPSSIQPSSSFQVIYGVSGISGKYGVSIIDNVSGGCTFPTGTNLKSVMLSDEGTIKTITVIAPPSGSCTFTGDYKFGSEETKNFPDSIVTISSTANQTTTTTTTLTSTTETPVPSFDINMVLFKLGEFNVTLIMLVGGIIVLLLLFKLVGGKK